MPQPDRAPGLRHARSPLRHSHEQFGEGFRRYYLRHCLAQSVEQHPQAPRPAVLGDEGVTWSFLRPLSWTSFGGGTCPGSFV